MKTVPVKQSSNSMFRVVHFDSEHTNKKSRSEQVFNNFSFFPDSAEELDSMKKLEQQYPEAKGYERKCTDFDIDMYLLNSSVYRNINREKTNYEIRKNLIDNKAKSNSLDKSVSRQSTLDSENPEEIFEAQKNNKASSENQGFFSGTVKKVIVVSAIALGAVGAFVIGNKWFRK